MFHQVLACDVTGMPHDWLSWEDAITLKVKGSIAYEIGEPEIVAHGGTSRLTGLESVVDVASIICLKGKFKRRDKVSLTNQNLFRRDLNTCGYCGKTFADEHRLSRDHIKPRSKGGLDVWTNVITACKSCNNLKDDLTTEEAGMPILYVPYEPSHCEALILKNRRILANQMEFLLSHIPSQSRLHKLYS